MQDKLEILHNHNEVKYKYILFDKWFSGIKNLVFIDAVLNKEEALKIVYHKVKELRVAYVFSAL